MLTYGPGSNILMGQRGLFINMYSRQPVFNGSIPFKSRGHISQLKMYNCNVRQEKVLIVLELAGSA